uniref:Putative netrin 1 n=1 Tax=Ixodes ricinus TaxID=34613 RepID=A0A147BUQ0_IXORI
MWSTRTCASWATWYSTCGTAEARKPSWRTILQVRRTPSSGTSRCSSMCLTWSLASWRRTCTTTSPAWRPSCRTLQRPRSSASSTRWTSCPRRRGSGFFSFGKRTSTSFPSPWSVHASRRLYGTRLSIRHGPPLCTRWCPTSSSWRPTSNSSPTS